MLRPFIVKVSVLGYFILHVSDILNISNNCITRGIQLYTIKYNT